MTTTKQVKALIETLKDARFLLNHTRQRCLLSGTELPVHFADVIQAATKAIAEVSIRTESEAGWLESSASAFAPDFTAGQIPVECPECGFGNTGLGTSGDHAPECPDSNETRAGEKPAARRSNGSRKPAIRRCPECEHRHPLHADRCPRIQ